MKRKVIQNYIYNLIYQILIMILPLITTPYLSRILNAEGIGVYSYTVSITTYFILFGSLGISMYAQREIAYVQDKKYERSKVFYEIVILRFITLSISLILFYVFFVQRSEYGLYYKILLIEIIANMLDISFFFQGLEEFKKIIIRNLIVKILSIFSVFLWVKSQEDVWIYLLIYVLSTFIGNCSLWFYLYKYIQKVLIKDLNLQHHIKPIIILFIPQIATQVYTLLDKTMIGSIINEKAEVGYYEQSQKIVKIILSIVTALGTVMLPMIANKYANGKKDEIKEDIRKSFKLIYFLTFPMMFGIIAISKNFIKIFLGDGFDKSATIICVISPIILMIGMSSIIGTQYLLPIKKQKEFSISVIGGAIINLCLNFILIKKFMSIGASIATVVAETGVTVIQLFFIRKDFKLKEILLMSKKYLLASILMYCVLIVIKYSNVASYLTLYIGISNLVMEIFLQIFIGIFIYVIILLVLQDEYMKKILDYTLKKIRRILNIGE